MREVCGLRGGMVGSVEILLLALVKCERRDSSRCLQRELQKETSEVAEEGMILSPLSKPYDAEKQRLLKGDKRGVKEDLQWRSWKRSVVFNDR